MYLQLRYELIVSDELFSPDFNLFVAELSQDQFLQDSATENMRLAGFPQGAIGTRLGAGALGLAHDTS